MPLINLPIEERILAGTYIRIFVSDSREELENLVTLIVTNEQEKEEIMRTIAQKYREEGKYEGIQQGIETRNLAIAQHMLFKLHLDLDTVQQATGVTKEDLQKIVKK